MSDPSLLSVQYVVIGGGGHAGVVVDALRATGYAGPAGILDVDRARWGTTVDGVPVLGDDTLLSQLSQRGITHFAIGVGGTRDNGPRRRVFDAAIAAGLHPMTVRHPRAYIAASAAVAPSAQLMCQAVVNSHAVVGENVIVNTAAIVEHDCRIHAHVHLATAARVASGVTVGEGAHIGAGATVVQSITIGTGAVIGAGACVVHDVLPHTTVVGVPARPVAAAERV